MVNIVGTSLKDRSVLIIGRPSGIAGAITAAARARGAQVIVAGRDERKLREAYRDDDGGSGGNDGHHR
jgi:NAD(P)-dependent dehydrogenase (short-subunit alcohol dehydrogenase family)